MRVSIMLQSDDLAHLRKQSGQTTFYTLFETSKTPCPIKETLPFSRRRYS